MSTLPKKIIFHQTGFHMVNQKLKLSVTWNKFVVRISFFFKCHKKWPLGKIFEIKRSTFRKINFSIMPYFIIFDENKLQLWRLDKKCRLEIIKHVMFVVCEKKYLTSEGPHKEWNNGLLLLLLVFWKRKYSCACLLLTLQKQKSNHYHSNNCNTTKQLLEKFVFFIEN